MKAKKIIVLLTIVCMLLSLVACGEDKTPNTTNNDENQVQTDINDMEEVSDELVVDGDKETDEKQSDRKSRRLLELRSIYYDYSSDYYLDGRSVADVIYSINPDTRQSEIMVGVYDGCLSEFEGTLEEVLEQVNNSVFVGNVSESGSGGLPYGLFGEDIEVISSEEVTIAGYDSIKYTGTIVNSPFEDETWQCNVYGYTFLIDEVPYAVLGFVTTREQEQSIIDEMIAEVDAIAGSIRTEE